MQNAKCKHLVRSPPRSGMRCALCRAKSNYSVFAFCILNFAFRRSVLQLHHRHPTPALVWRRELEAGDERMSLEELGKRAAQLPGPMAMNQADGALIRDGAFVEELFRAADCFVHRAADHVQV